MGLYDEYEKGGEFLDSVKIKTDPSKLETRNQMIADYLEKNQDISDDVDRIRKESGLPPILKEISNPLDYNGILCNVDFMSKIDSSQLISRLASNVAHVCYLPVHSVFLAAIGVFSSIACRQYRVNYKHGGSLPISLYVMAEQPSGAAKSRALNVFQHPFRAARKEAQDKRKERLIELSGGIDEDDAAEAKELVKPLPPLFVTNATPEALEQTLPATRGFFAAVSSEKGLANAILGASYGDSSRANNNDVLLNGFDGGYVASLRVSRDCYEGNVVGGVVVIAQQGSIERLLLESDGSGLAERFLLISESHYLGTRDFNEERHFNDNIIEAYNDVCEKLCNGMSESPLDYDSLVELTISDNGHSLIAEYRNSIEPLLGDGGRYSAVSMRGAAAKIDMQIMKIAANLHLMSGMSGFLNIIGDRHILDAIAIASEMLEANVELCDDKGINGLKAEYSSVLSLFERSPQPRTARSIIQVKSKTSPFKEMNFKKGMNRSKYIRELLQKMVDDSTLIKSLDGSGCEVFKCG